jgi:hypothetical protein
MDYYLCTRNQDIKMDSTQPLSLTHKCLAEPIGKIGNGKQQGWNESRRLEIINLALELIEKDHIFRESKDSLASFDSPALTQVSTSTSCDTSISSLSSSSTLSEESNANANTVTSSSRSIFKKYWSQNQVQNARAFIPAPAYPLTVAFTQETSGNDSKTSYERTLKVSSPQSQSQYPPPSPSGRRSIFQSTPKYMSQSQPCLTLNDIASDCFRKRSLSTSALQTKSCLRPARYSGDRRASIASDTTANSVSFKEQTERIVYQQPVEHWAADGWSKNFSD